MLPSISISPPTNGPSIVMGNVLPPVVFTPRAARPLVTISNGRFINEPSPVKVSVSSERAAMGANKRAARPDSPACNFSLRGRGMLDRQGVILTESLPSSISPPRAAAMLKATFVSSQSLIP